MMPIRVSIYEKAIPFSGQAVADGKGVSPRGLFPAVSGPLPRGVGK